MKQCFRDFKVTGWCHHQILITTQYILISKKTTKFMLEERFFMKQSNCLPKKCLTFLYLTKLAKDKYLRPNWSNITILFSFTPELTSLEHSSLTGIIQFCWQNTLTKPDIGLPFLLGTEMKVTELLAKIYSICEK